MSVLYYLLWSLFLEHWWKYMTDTGNKQLYQGIKCLVFQSPNGVSTAPYKDQGGLKRQS